MFKTIIIHLAALAPLSASAFTNTVVGVGEVNSGTCQQLAIHRAQKAALYDAEKQCGSKATLVDHAAIRSNALPCWAFFDEPGPPPRTVVIGTYQCELELPKTSGIVEL